jgi:hypothetical protein
VTAWVEPVSGFEPLTCRLQEVLEVLHPGISGFATPEGSAASADHDATQINQGIQVGASKIDGAIPHNYRPGMVTLRLNADMNAATSITRANPQYGAGGIRHYFIPNIADAIKAGSISVVGADGSELPIHMAGTSVTIDPATAGRLADTMVLFTGTKGERAPRALTTEVSGQVAVVAYTDEQEADRDCPQGYTVYQAQVSDLLSDLPDGIGLVIDPLAPSPVYIPPADKGKVIRAALLFPTGARIRFGQPKTEPVAVLDAIRHNLPSERSIRRATGAGTRPPTPANAC